MSSSLDCSSCPLSSSPPPPPLLPLPLPFILPPSIPSPRLSSWLLSMGWPGGPWLPASYPFLHRAGERRRDGKKRSKRRRRKNRRSTPSLSDSS